MPNRPEYGVRVKFLVKGPIGGKLLRHKRSKIEADRDFWSRVEIRGADDCWPWTAGTNNGKRNGVGSYGVLWVNGKRYKAHRFAFASKSRMLKPAELVCHTCDNPICCNPRHLFAGTSRDNYLDCIKKGRAHKERGEDRYNATLNESNVRRIRELYIPRVFGVDPLAEMFGVSRSMIFAIVKRKRWKHVA